MTLTILTGDNRAVLPTLESGSVQTCVTSPPYFGLRDYSTATWEGGDPVCDHRRQEAPRSTRPLGLLHGHSDDHATQYHVYRQTCGKCGAVRIDNQIGLEDTPEAYIAALVDVFREVKRVLRNDGTLWVVIGDSYNNNASNQQNGAAVDGPYMAGAFRSQGRRNKMIKDGDLKQKDLIGIPYMLAFALRAEGWYWRSAITWCKNSPMPESVTDRPTQATEMVLLFAKSERYFYDAQAIAEESKTPAGLSWEERKAIGPGKNAGVSWRKDVDVAYAGTLGNGTTRNKRNWWVVNSQPYPGQHYAVFPEKLIEPMILAGSSAHGCCSQCGAPWARVVEREASDAQRQNYHGVGKVPRHRGGASRVGGFYPDEPQTTGWQATCAHTDAPVRPCVVLDCFGGSGTTGKVAIKHGRSAVLIELNPAYVDQSLDRTNGVQTMMDVTT